MPSALSEPSDRSLEDLFARVVSLEQSLCHQEIQRRSALAATPTSSTLTPPPSNGILVWRIDEFSSEKLTRLKHRQPISIYSPAFFTSSPLGYKMCLRCSVRDNFLGIFVHFMPGEDDDLLKWPFAGQFHLRLKNQSQKQQPGTTADLIEKMPSQPKMTAFDCPSPEGLRNPIGFGLQELISIDELMNEGFWDSSRDQSRFLRGSVIWSDVA